MQKNGVKSYGILHPFLGGWDSCDETDCDEEEKDCGRGSVLCPELCPKPGKDSGACHHEREIVFKLIIYNTCGNNNELKVCHPEVTTSAGCLDDIKDGFVISLAEALKDLMSNCAGTIGKLTIPVYVINVNNVLTSGNKNEICIE